MANEIMIGDIGVVEANPKVAVTRGDNTAARNIEAAGAMLGDVAQGVQQARTRGALSDVAAGLSAAEQVITSREQLGYDAGEEAIQIAAIEEGMTDRARKNFAAIRAGLDQQGGGRSAAARKATLLAEREIRSISALTPGFGQQIRQTAAQVLGFDPTGATMERLFGMQDPKPQTAKTEQEKLKDYLGPYYNETAGFRAFAYLNQYPQATAESTMQWMQDTGTWKYENDTRVTAQQLENGSITQEKATNDIIRASAPTTTFSAMTTNLLTVAGTEGLTSFDQVKLSAGLDEWVDNQLQIAKRKGIVDQAQLDRLSAHYESAIAPYRKLATEEGANQFQILKENADTFQQMARRNLQLTAREFMTLSEGMNPTMAKEVFNLYLNSGSNAVLQNRLKAFPYLGELIDEDGSIIASKAFLGSTYSTMTGNPNPFPVNDERGQAEMDKLAAANARATGGLAKEDVSVNVQEADPKGTITDVAKKPQLGLTIPDGKAWDKFSGNFHANTIELADDLAAELYSQNAGVSVGMETVRTQTRDGIVEKQVPTLQFQGEGGLFGPGVPAQVERLNATFGKIVDDPKLSRRLFNGNQVTREQYLRNVAQLTAVNINNRRMAAIEHQIQMTTDDFGRRVELGTANDEYRAEFNQRVQDLNAQHAGLKQANDFARDQLRKAGMEVE